MGSNIEEVIIRDTINYQSKEVFINSSIHKLVIPPNLSYLQEELFDTNIDVQILKPYIKEGNLILSKNNNPPVQRVVFRLPYKGL